MRSGLIVLVLLVFVVALAGCNQGRSTESKTAPGQLKPKASLDAGPATLKLR